MALRRGLPLIAIAVLAGCGGGGGKHATGTSTDAHGCVAVTAPAPKQRSEPKPRAQLDATKAYDVTLRTNCGSFTIRLDVKTSPATTASFVSLARRRYFDHTIFHRIVPGFVIQGGDPTARGAGGPGYETVDKPPTGARYTHGVVAMAKTPTEAPGTAGSQFFVVTGDDARLPPDYAILGKVTKGLDVVDRIGVLCDANERPTQNVVISKVRTETS